MRTSSQLFIQTTVKYRYKC